MPYQSREWDVEEWEHAKGDSEYAAWLSKVDALCLRFLDQDLLSVPMLNLEDRLDPLECYERSVTPSMYFLEVVEQLKLENGIDLMDEFIAKQAKWGAVCPFLER
jgi:hypothetical protein